MVGEFAEVDGGLLGEDGLDEEVADDVGEDHEEMAAEVGAAEFPEDGEAEGGGGEWSAPSRCGSGRCHCDRWAVCAFSWHGCFAVHGGCLRTGG